MTTSLEIITSDLSVLPRNFERLNFTYKLYFKTLDNFRAPFLQEKLAIEGEITDPNEFNEAFTEFKKYVALNRVFRKPLAMTSDKIDAVWHQFILFTRDYMDFCDMFYGGYLHHNPNIPSRQYRIQAAQDERRNLIEMYTKTYGPMPSIWNVCGCEAKK
jgi:hypothetical protein